MEDTQKQNDAGEKKNQLSIMYSFSKYLLTTYYGPGCILSLRNKLNKELLSKFCAVGIWGYVSFSVETDSYRGGHRVAR